MANKKIISRVGGFWSEFQRFAVKGNALELAVAVVVGNAFTAIVNSLVSDIITPLIGLIPGAGDSDFKNRALILRPAAVSGTTHTAALLLNYGSFFSAIFNFLVVALSIFIFFKIFVSMRKRLFARPEETPAYVKPAQELLLEEIRDLLKEEAAGRHKTARE